MNLKKGLLCMHLALSMLLIFDVFIWYRYGFSFRGYWSDRIILWLWVINACLLMGAHWKQHSTANIWLKTITVLGIYSIAPMVFPLILLSHKLIDTDNAIIHKLTPDYRLDEVRQRSSRIAKILVIEHQALLEKEVGSFYTDTATHHYNLQDVLKQAGLK